MVKIKTKCPELDHKPKTNKIEEKKKGEKKVPFFSFYAEKVVTLQKSPFKKIITCYPGLGRCGGTPEGAGKSQR